MSSPDDEALLGHDEHAIEDDVADVDESLLDDMDDISEERTNSDLELEVGEFVELENGPPAKKPKIEQRSRSMPTTSESRVTRGSVVRSTGGDARSGSGSEADAHDSGKSEEHSGSEDGESVAIDEEEEMEEGDLEGEENADPEQEDEEGEGEGEDEQEDEDEDTMGNGEEDEHHDLLDDSNGRIKVGDDYQACIQVASPDELNDIPDRDELMWCLPEENIPKETLLAFVEMAIGVYHLTYDRALFILLRCDHVFEKAAEMVRKRRLVVDEWSEDDRNVFRQSFAHYGKNFRKIRQALPHRSMQSIIAFYYNTKKEQQYKELFAGKNVHSDSDRDDDPDEGEEGPCENCGDKEGKLRHVSAGRLCKTCRVYHSITNRHRPTNFRNLLPDPCDITVRRELAKCPAEMVEVAAEFEQMARDLENEQDNIKTESSEVEAVDNIDNKPVIVHRTPTTMANERNDMVKAGIFRIRSRCMRVQAHLKNQQEHSLRNGVEKFRYLMPKEEEKEKNGKNDKDDEKEKPNRRQRMAYTWTEKEKLTVFHCLARYGVEFDIIADIVQTKSADQIKSFYSEIKSEVDDYLQEVEQAEERMAKEMNMEKEVGIEVDCVELD